MTALTELSQTSRLSSLQNRISITTWVIVLLLSMRGLLTFYGMKQKSLFENVINFITEPVVQLFNFKMFSDLEIPALGTFVAAITLLIASYIAQFFIKVTEHRIHRTRELFAQQVIRAK